MWALKRKRSGGRPNFGGRLVGCFWLNTISYYCLPVKQNC